MQIPIKLVTILFISLTSLFVCTCNLLEEKSADFLNPVLGTHDAPSVLYAIPVSGATNVTPLQQIVVAFSKDVDSQRCMAAFSISPLSGTVVSVPVAGTLQVAGSALTFTPTNPFATGTYSFSVAKTCEDTEGRDLDIAFTSSFVVAGGALTSPAQVVAVGLESHDTGCDAYGDVGSSTGGDQTLSSCWWDSSLSMLTPSSYLFRGGDTGTSPASCADATTDNFRLIFNSYMVPAVTVNAVSLTRLSSISTVRLASHTWTDCQAASPFGCRVLTLKYAEAEATCNGTVNFGDISTGGDFNIQETLGSASGHPMYILSVDQTARDVDENSPAYPFSFTFTGN